MGLIHCVMQMCLICSRLYLGSAKLQATRGGLQVGIVMRTLENDMSNIMRMPAAELAVGAAVRTEDETIWGWRAAWHTLATAKCDLETRMLVVELRDGPILRYLLVLERDATLTTCKEES